MFQRPIYLFQDNHVGKLSNPPEKCSDMDSHVLDCYIMCCQAEAQEGKSLILLVNLPRFNTAAAKLFWRKFEPTALKRITRFDMRKIITAFLPFIHN